MVFLRYFYFLCKVFGKPWKPFHYAEARKVTYEIRTGFNFNYYIMKKSLFLTIVLSLVVSVSAMAQPRAIGVNLGYGIDLSYQHTLSPSNMIDLNVNIPAFAGIGASCTYDWLNPFGTQIPWNNKGKWDWEMGVGGGAGYYFASAWYAGAVGHVGVSYDFWFPLQLSLDWRPNIGVYGASNTVGFNGSGLYSGITLGVRYLF